VEVVGSNLEFRFINTHLEVFSNSINDAQAEELLNDPADTNMPVIVVGDMNAVPSSATYDRFIDAGFDDAWREDHPTRSGFTCCQSGSLKNDESNLSRRIDFVFVRGDITVRAAKLVGEDEDDQTSSGLWPSDHAGVVAKLRLD
jgi:endonuclease/exonuclease/phosphatase family metal-dependent hydrolase